MTRAIIMPHRPGSNTCASKDRALHRHRLCAIEDTVLNQDLARIYPPAIAYVIPNRTCLFDRTHWSNDIALATLTTVLA
jgi:hypothetical protein